MADHIVLGSGNLGKHLSEQFNCPVVSKSSGHDFMGDLNREVQRLKGYKFEYLWCTVGAGSVGEAKKNFHPFVQLHLSLPVALNEAFPDAKIITFSSDYVACPFQPEDPNLSAPMSLYAYSKSWMEDYIRMANNDNIRAIRVGSLYGNHKPQTTFPGRLRARYPSPQEVSLPPNQVTPTPTKWLASVLSENYSKLFEGNLRIHHLAPEDPIQILKWGQWVLGKKYSYKTSPPDFERPQVSNLQNTLGLVAPSCEELWSKYGF